MSSTGVNRQILEELPVWLLASCILLPLVLGFIASQLPNNYETGSIQMYLSALAGAQAAVIAIVFSVTILGIQLVGDRYSPRMITLFVESRIFQFTFGIFVISIGVDLWLLYNAPDQLFPEFVTLTFAASGLALGAVISLYQFVKLALERMTPEGVITAYAQDLQPTKYKRRACAAMENDNLDSHPPLHPLFSLVMSALSRHEWVTAERGIYYINDIFETTLGHFVAEDELPKNPDEFWYEAFAPVTKEYLPDIAIYAFEKSQYDLSKQAISVLGQIGSEGLTRNCSFITEQAGRGLGSIIDELPPTHDGNTVRRPAFRELGELLRAASQEPNPNVLWDLLDIIRDQFDTLFERNAERSVYNILLVQYFSDLQAVFSSMLEAYEYDLSEANVDWYSQGISEDIPDERVFAAFLIWREAMLSASFSVLQHVSENSEYPIQSQTFYDIWEEVGVLATQSAASDYATALCSDIIELSYEVHWIEGVDESGWVSILARIMNRGDPDCVVAAFDKLSDSGRSEFVHQLRVSSSDERRRSRPPRHIASEMEDEFQNWLMDFRATVQETYEVYADELEPDKK